MTLLPSISVVTSSFNQGCFLEACMHSVLDQNYPHLEYLVVDGGSTDGSVETIRSFADRLSYWRSYPDEGHWTALNEGFGRSTGEIMAWLNSDDLYTPWTFRVVGEIFATLPEVEWITSGLHLVLSEGGAVTGTKQAEGFNRDAFFRGRNLPLCSGFYSGFIQQESTFWRRALWERAGARMDTAYSVATDFELWARFWQRASLYAVSVPLACFRIHSNQRTALRFGEYLQEGERVLGAYGYHPPSRAELLVRRALRQLPDRLRQRLPESLAFSAGIVQAIQGTNREHTWRIVKRRFV